MTARGGDRNTEELLVGGTAAASTNRGSSGSSGGSVRSRSSWETMQLELTVENVARKTKPGRGDPPHFARSPATLADRDATRETPSGPGTFLGPVTTEATKEAVERGGGAGFFSDPLRTLAVEQHSRHSVDSFVSADCLLADSDGDGVGSGGISTNGRSSTGGRGEGAGGTGFFSDPLRTLTVKQHSRHSVDSFASADCLLADSSGGGREGIGGGICNDGRLSSDGERLTDGGGGVAAITHGEMMESRERGREDVEKEEEEGGAAGSMPLRRDDNYGEGEFVFFLEGRGEGTAGRRGVAAEEGGVYSCRTWPWSCARRPSHPNNAGT